METTNGPSLHLLLQKFRNRLRSPGVAGEKVFPPIKCGGVLAVLGASRNVNNTGGLVIRAAAAIDFA
jgi:hypothetical protein